MEKLFAFLRRHSKRWWYLPLVCLLAFIDLYVVFIPTEGMIILSSMMLPRRWILTGLAVTTASSIGALSIALLTKSHGEPFVAWLAGSNFLQTEIWIRTERWVADYGFWGVSFVALGPLPQQPAIMIGALAHMPTSEIFWAVWLGRVPKYLLVSYLATKGEQWIRAEFANHESWGNFLWLRNMLLKLVHDPEDPKN